MINFLPEDLKIFYINTIIDLRVQNKEDPTPTSLTILHENRVNESVFSALK